MCSHHPYSSPLLALLLMAVLLAACSTRSTPRLAAPASAEERRSHQGRAAARAARADLEALTTGTTAFALDLYHALAQENGNLFFSPQSVSQAVAMTSAGAVGTTAEQMRSTVTIDLPDERLHADVHALGTALATPRGNGDQPGFLLPQANALWGQRDRPVQPTFLDLLARHYGARLRVGDFNTAPERAHAHQRLVREQTEQMIPELLPAGSITADTRLVLTNAIYFTSTWQATFDPSLTMHGPFTLADGTQVTVPMMHKTTSLRYGEDVDYQAVELASPGDAAMIVLLPRADRFDAFETGLTAARLQMVIDRLAPQEVFLTLPKLDFTSSIVDLKPVLEALGMRDAVVLGQANFSGMDSTRELYIGGILHRAALLVDEHGTLAAAATGVTLEGAAAPEDPPPEMRVDHPFMLLIRDTRTGALLFVGRIVDPRA